MRLVLAGVEAHTAVLDKVSRDESCLESTEAVGSLTAERRRGAALRAADLGEGLRVLDLPPGEEPLQVGRIEVRGKAGVRV